MNDSGRQKNPSDFQQPPPTPQHFSGAEKERKSADGPPPILPESAKTLSSQPPPLPKMPQSGKNVEEDVDDSDNGQPFLRRQRPEAEMDMTPMVDVVFLLLIFFMITAAFGLQKSIEMPDPESDQSSQQEKIPEEKEDDSILVQVTAEDRIFVEGEEATTQQELYAKLREQIHTDSSRRARHLLVQAESEATHELVVRVLDAASGVGMDSIRLKTE